MPHPREVIAPGKSLGQSRRVHHGVSFPLCGNKGVGLMLSDKWTVVDCGACLHVMHARHDKPNRK